jgi:hypothetical protein
MSLFQFLASDKLLKEVKNPYIEFISIKEALKRNIKLYDFIMNDTEIDKEDKIIMVCDSEEYLQEIEINHDMYYSSEYAEEYSNKQYFSELHWHYTEARAKQLVDYLRDQLKSSDEVEIWSIWLDEHKSASIKSINVNELSIADLKFLDTSDGYEKPKCLVIKK